MTNAINIIDMNNLSEEEFFYWIEYIEEFAEQTEKEEEITFHFDSKMLLDVYLINMN